VAAADCERMTAYSETDPLLSGKARDSLGRRSYFQAEG